MECCAAFDFDRCQTAQRKHEKWLKCEKVKIGCVDTRRESIDFGPKLCQRRSHELALDAERKQSHSARLSAVLVAQHRRLETFFQFIILFCLFVLEIRSTLLSPLSNTLLIESFLLFFRRETMGTSTAAGLLWLTVIISSALSQVSIHSDAPHRNSSDANNCTFDDISADY